MTGRRGPAGRQRGEVPWRLRRRARSRSRPSPRGRRRPRSAPPAGLRSVRRASVARYARGVGDAADSLVRRDVDYAAGDEIALGLRRGDGQWLLDQLEPDLLVARERARRVADRPHAVDVDEQPHVWADSVPDRLQAVEVTIYLIPPGVQLEPAIGLALLERLLDDTRRILVPGDRPVHLNTVAERAAEQRRCGHAGMTAANVNGANRSTRASSASSGTRCSGSRPTSALATRVSTSSTTDACVSDVNAWTGHASPQPTTPSSVTMRTNTFGELVRSVVPNRKTSLNEAASGIASMLLIRIFGNTI